MTARPRHAGASTTGVLRTGAELVSARARASELGLCPSPDPRKYWDNVRALEILEQSRFGRSDPVVDLGCRSGIVLTWLHERGYRQLYGCDIRAPLPPLRAAWRGGHWLTVTSGLRMLARHGTRMRRAPVESTGFPSSFFSAATCMSVVEHGVDLSRFFAECARILRPGGVLVLSTDFWPEPIDLGGLKRFSVADRIFDRAGAVQLCESASSHGLHVIGEVKLDIGEAVIESDGFYFTFLMLVFERV